MNKFATKIVCGLATLAMAAGSFVACGGSKEEAYFIGGTGPLTGSTAQYGTSVQKGAAIAIDEINKNGGLNGVSFKFDMKDDQGTEDLAKTGFNSLFESGMQASIGSVTSGSCASFSSEAVKNKVFSITPSASAANVIATGDNIFRVCFGDPQQGEIAAVKLTETYTNLGVIYDTSDTYSSGLYDAFSAKMTELGKTFEKFSFDQDHNKDFSTQVSKLKDANCDVIFLPIYYEQAGLIAKAAAKIGYNVPIFGCDGLDGVAGQLDSTVTANISYITPFDVASTDEKVVNFVAAYKAKYNETPDQFAADGYDAVMVIYEAMKAAGVNDVNIKAADLNEKLVATLTGGTFKYSGVTGDGMTWDKAGSCNKEAKIVNVAH